MKNYLALGCLLPVFMAGCSGPEPAQQEKKVEKAAEPVTGQSALWKMYQVARSWAPDARIVKMNSLALSEVKAAPGKSGAWQAFFSSDEKAKVRSYTYSVVEADPIAHLGVFAGAQEPWSGREPEFVIATVRIDSDAALKTAESKAAVYKQQTEGKPISFLLETTKRSPNPAWRVIWGESVGTATLSVYIDAMTGAYLETLH
jgi:hypothetical protein